ncbi:hypothetical protein DL96DRAFT_1707439 [Flagelloscypha sp. PMI_526]|nr:hypothetical protein DL96DRAFT_1707439 [Flagelloscypha sp. PMI_526]
MSRHRDIRNMDYEDALDDDALSDGGEEDMTAEQTNQMNRGLEEVYRVLGGEAVSGISDKDLRKHLWDNWFDPAPVIQWALEEQVRRERRESFAPNDPSSSSDGFPTPDNSSPLLLHEHIAKEGRRLDSRSNVPLIALAQRQMSQEHLNEPYAALEDDDTESHTSELSLPVMKALSTISERTELSDPGSRLPSVRRGGTRLTRLTVSQPDRETMTSSYGSVIETTIALGAIDPDTIPVSPSDSAIRRLSLYEGPPSPLTSEDSRSTILAPEPARSSSVPIPPLDAIPDISDLTSKSNVNTSQKELDRKGSTPSRPSRSTMPTPDVISPTPSPVSDKSRSLPPGPSPFASPSTVVSKQLPPTPSMLSSAPTLPPKRSKLSMLASSRTSLRSESSLMSGTAPTDTIRTYSVLRPSSQSFLRQSGIVSPILEASTPSEPGSPVQSSTAAHVQRAIALALELEADDKAVTSRARSSPAKSSVTDAPPKPAASSTANSHIGTQQATSQGGKRPSKLALLAQAKAAKAALQQPAASQGPILPKETTRYFTPIANGPTATTAITTSYQSLYSITDPNRREPTLGSHPVAPLVPNSGTPSSTEGSTKKQSKLAMKIKKTQEKHALSKAEPVDDEALPMLPAVFLRHSYNNQASPSQFASLLVDEDVPIKFIPHRSRDSHPKETPEERAARKERKAARRAAKAASAPHPPDFSPPLGFKFDGPSPDDILFNARQGTALGTDASTSPSRSSRRTPVSGRS